ncbi:hypothetical protein, partial [Gordonia oryzae]|uniref:hypothetical protein n=1 Tax=Gordonia oryzae TaxID=2487349 RepID=UPI003F855D44
SQDQTLHEKTSKPNSFNTNQESKPDKNKPKNWHKKLHTTPHKKSAMHKLQCHKKMAPNNPPIHYRVLKEHTPTNTTPHKRRTSVSCRSGFATQSRATRPEYQNLTLRPNPV